MRQHQRAQQPCRLSRPSRGGRRLFLAGSGLAIGMGLLGTPRPAIAGEVLTIGGDGGALAGIGVLARHYARANPGVTVSLTPSLGTTGGIRALLAGSIDLSVAARAPRDGEKAAGAAERPYGITAVAFGTHAENPARAVSLDEVARMFSGETTRWPDGTPVRVIRRPDDDSDPRLLAAYSPVLAAALATMARRPGLRIIASDTEATEAIERKPGSLGTLTMAQLLAEERAIVPLAFEGVAPTPGEVAAGRYRLTRTFRFITRGEPSAPAAAFIAYARSDAGRQVLASIGCAPV